MRSNPNDSRWLPTVPAQRMWPGIFWLVGLVALDEVGMQAGKLRHRLIIQTLNPNAAVTRDAHGGMVEEWQDVATVWGSVEPVRAVEILRANQVDARITHRITTRYQPGIDSAMRVLYGKRIFLLLNVMNPDERRIMLEMLAMETI